MWKNSVLKELPIDPNENNVPRIVKNACFSKVKPTPVKNPKLVAVSKEALQLLDLNFKEKEIERYLSGNELILGCEPAAHCYCGYQFGVFAGQLGDGRAIYLGEKLNLKGERFELQLKGSGKTPYSRDGDGRAVLRSSIREFLCSEAMHYLGIPTTRASTLITSDTDVFRDIKYDGNQIKEKATIVSRIAPTFLRFGSFHITDDISGRKGPSSGNKEILTKLVEYIIKHYYSDITGSLEKKVLEFAKEISWRTAYLVALWQSVGFTHGVINTDNMSVVGVTIDYGPFGFLDAYDPNYISNASDTEGRYKFKNQPGICRWNLSRLFKSLLLIVPQLKDKFNEILDTFELQYHQLYLAKMRRKLGLFKELLEDYQLIKDLLNAMEKTSGDYTNIFRCLSRFTGKNQPVLKYILKQCKVEREEHEKIWSEWLNQYNNRLQLEDQTEERIKMMTSHNPRYILRNYLVQIAIEKAEQGDYSEINRLHELLQDPYDEKGRFQEYVYDQLPPGWASELCVT